MTRRKREITGLANEQDFPHLVELAVPPEGFGRGAFRNRFGGECLTHAPDKPKPRASKHVPAKEPG